MSPAGWKSIAASPLHSVLQKLQLCLVRGLTVTPLLHGPVSSPQCLLGLVWQLSVVALCSSFAALRSSGVAASSVLLSFQKVTDPFLLGGGSVGCDAHNKPGDERPRPRSSSDMLWFTSRERANFWKWIPAEGYGSSAVQQPGSFCWFQAMLRISFCASSLRTQMAFTEWDSTFVFYA